MKLKNFTNYKKNPLPEPTDGDPWKRELVASLQENLDKLNYAVNGLGKDVGVSGWKDNLAALAGQPTGANAPTLANFGPTGNIKQPAFATVAGGDSVYVIWHIDHDIKPGSTGYMHVHWTTDGTSTDEVRWEITYTQALGHNQYAADGTTPISLFSEDTTVVVQEAASGHAWQHMVTEDQTGFLVPEPDSLIVAEVKRVATTPNNTDTVFGLFVDIHYESDRELTPQRAPDFYLEN